MILLLVSVLQLVQSGVYALVLRNETIITSPIPTGIPPISAALTSIDPSSDACDNIHNCRTLLSIIWSCLVTIFACIWVAVHRNIPGPRQRWITIRLEWLKIVVVTLLAPEWILAWAVRQFLQACEVAELLELARQEFKEKPDRPPVEEMRDTGSQGEAENNIMDEGGPEVDPVLPKSRAAEEGEAKQPVDAFAIETHLGRTNEPWTITHGFFVIMGGFHYYYDGKPLYPLDSSQVVALVMKGTLVPPTEDELKDKSKGDALSKSFVIIQTLWFVVQCIARRIDHFPITKLEVMTLAYTMITIAMYGFWWYKPLNVSCPARVLGKDKLGPRSQSNAASQMELFFSTVLGVDDVVDLQAEQRVPTFYSGGGYADETLLASGIITLLITMVFGAVHCVAWSYAFPSHVEKLLWRLSALSIVAVPVVIILSFVIAAIISESEVSDVFAYVIWYTVSVVGALLYIAARILLLTLSFTTLRSLPLAAYQTVQWTTFIPHI